MSRWLEITDELGEYVLAHGNPPTDEVSAQLSRVTQERYPERAGMNIGDDQGRFLSMLTAATGARFAVEVGTFTGMSALWIARGLPADGRLVCFDITDEYLPTAREAWEAAGVADRIEVRVGPAADELATLDDEPPVDIAFVDADKTGYAGYLEQLLPRLSGRGLIAFDNVLWGGTILDRSANDADTVALREFNDEVARRPDLRAVMLTVGDGITLVSRV